MKNKEYIEELERQVNIAKRILKLYANRDFKEYDIAAWDRGVMARYGLILINKSAEGIKL